MHRNLLRILFLAALSLMAAQAANIVVNGGFEAPAVPSGNYSLFYPSIPGWTLATGDYIELQNHIAGTPAEGSQFLELDSTGNSSVYQDLNTLAGQSYLLSFLF